MNEKEEKLLEAVVWFNTHFSVVPDTPKHFKREGVKDNVRAELRTFNGKPQLIIWYGKSQYRFNLVMRNEPKPVEALLRIYGYNGIENMPDRILQRFFNESEIELRRRGLKERGV